MIIIFFPLHQALYNVWLFSSKYKLWPFGIELCPEARNSSFISKFLVFLLKRKCMVSSNYVLLKELSTIIFQLFKYLHTLRIVILYNFKIQNMILCENNFGYGMENVTLRLIRCIQFSIRKCSDINVRFSQCPTLVMCL